MKQIKPFTGKWRITEMEVWDQDYVDMEAPGYIRINSDGTGQFQPTSPPTKKLLCSAACFGGPSCCG
ncbi:MAG: hypothetical protein WAL90_11455 [Desulfobacterales bacterium]